MQHITATKQKKREARITKRTPGVASNAAPVVRTHITKLPLVGSKILQSVAGFAAAGAFYQYEVFHNVELTAIFGGAAVAVSVIAAAPYAKSILRTNSSLYNADMALSPLSTIDATLSGLKNDILGVPNSILKNPVITGISSNLSKQYQLLQTTYLLAQAGEQKLVADIGAIGTDMSNIGPSVINQLSKDYTNFTNSFNALKSVVTSLPDASAITGLLNSEMSPLTNDMKNLSSGIGNIRNGISGIDSTVQGLPNLSSIQGAFNSGISGLSGSLSSLAQSIPSNTSSGASSSASSVTSDISRIFRGL